MSSERRWLFRASGEFAVIVVGVLVALALEGWWQAREDRLRESAYLESIVAELDSYVEEMERSLLNHTSAHSRLEKARGLLENGRHADNADEFIADLVAASTWFPVMGVSTAVFDDLVSTGNIRLIRNDALRTSIIEAYSTVQVNMERLTRAEESIRPGLSALLSRYLPPNAVSRGFMLSDVSVSADPADVAAIRAAAQSLVSDSAFEPELNAEYRRFEGARQQMARHAEVVRGHLGRIETEIERLGLSGRVGSS